MKQKMKIIKSFFIVMTLIIVACNQSESNQPEPVNNEAIENLDPNVARNNVAAAVDSLNNAIVNPDRSVLENLTSEELTYGHSGGLVQNKEEFVQDLINGNFNFSSVNGEDQEIFISGETAIVRQIFVAEATNMDEPVDIRIGNILVYQKQDDQWKLLARQAFRL